MPAKISFSLLIFCWVWLWLAGTLFAQTTVGMGTETPNPNAVLELVSAGMNQGFLVPRFTTAQRTASGFTGKLSANDNGLLVFDTDEGEFYYWYRGGWQQGIGAGSLEGTGTVWYTGNTLPDNNEGKNGDFYIHTLSGDVYRKQNGVFSVIGNMLPQQNQYVAGAGISISNNNEITNTGDLDAGNETITKVSLQTGDILRIQEAGVSHDVDLGIYQKTALNDGNIFVGNATHVATQVAMSGDATLANDGTVKVAGLQGRPVAASAPASGNTLTWNGTVWEPQSSGKGTDWYEGKNVPNAGDPASAGDGDYYYKTDTETVFRKESGTWVEQGKWFKPSDTTVGGVAITEITAPTLYIGNGAPNHPDSNGRPGDMYYDASDDELYIKDKIDHWKKL